MPSPSKIVTHEVGNLSIGADEDMHRRFVLNGGGPNTVSFHFVVGPTKIVQLLYLDENAWHASDGYFGDGNRDAWGIEHIQVGDFQATLNHGAWLQAELARNPRRFAIKNPGAFVQDINPENVDERMVQHNWEAPDGKNCPEFIRERGLWDGYVEAVRVSVQTPPPGPVYATPAPISWQPGIDTGWFDLNGRPVYAMRGSDAEAKKTTVRRTHASASAPKAAPNLLAGEHAIVIGSFAIPRQVVRNGVTKTVYERWVIFEDLSRARATSLTPLFPIRP